MTMFRSGRILGMIFCSSVLCLLSTCLFNMQRVPTSTNPLASQQVEARQKCATSFCEDRVIGGRKETVIDDGVVPTQKGRNTTQKSFDLVEFRIFQDNNDHLIYLYDRLITSIPWEPNPRNLAEFREKLMNHTNSTFQEEFVLTHQNAMAGDRIPYSFNNMSNSKMVFYKVSKQFMAEDVPPASPLSGKRFKRCSVVGNSGLLSNSKCGQEIDQSDYVIRSNLPPIRSHAADAGWKTNLTTMNPSVVQRRYNNLMTNETTISFVKAIGDYYGVLWLPCVASTAMIGLCLKAKHTLDNYNVENPESIIANPSHYLAVMDFWKERTLTQFITTGFYKTHLSLTMCEETHLYGFWPFPYRVLDMVTETGTNMMKEVKYHYFDKLGVNAVHSLSDEFSVLLQMHALGLLKLHVRDCDV